MSATENQRARRLVQRITETVSRWQVAPWQQPAPPRRTPLSGELACVPSLPVGGQRLQSHRAIRGGSHQIPFCRWTTRFNIESRCCATCMNTANRICRRRGRAQAQRKPGGKSAKGAKARSRRWRLSSGAAAAPSLLRAALDVLSPLQSLRPQRPARKLAKPAARSARATDFHRRVQQYDRLEGGLEADRHGYETTGADGRPFTAVRRAAAVLQLQSVTRAPKATAHPADRSDALEHSGRRSTMSSSVSSPRDRSPSKRDYRLAHPERSVDAP